MTQLRGNECIPLASRYVSACSPDRREARLYRSTLLRRERHLGRRGCVEEASRQSPVRDAHLERRRGRHGRDDQAEPQPGLLGGNELFYADNTKMLFSDVEEAVAEITAAAKDMEEAQALTVGTFNVERSSLQRDIGS